VRLFTAIELGDATRAQAAAIISALRARVELTAPRARVTWIAQERLHLTVRFIGEVEGPLAERVISGLRAPLTLPPFTIAFGPLGAFPAKGAPRAVWIGLADGGDAVARVESAISDRLLALGIPKEDRPYSPHLTLARVREPAGLRAAPLFESLAAGPDRTRVDAITLFQSKLSPKGPTYTVLERMPLRAG
jgi:RNA 2',3'-cyclic 3'-phosphodiesterase